MEPLLRRSSLVSRRRTLSPGFGPEIETPSAPEIRAVCGRKALVRSPSQAGVLRGPRGCGNCAFSIGCCVTPIAQKGISQYHARLSLIALVDHAMCTEVAQG